MLRTARQKASLIVVALLAVAGVAALRSAREPIATRPDTSGLCERIQISVAAANSRNDRAIALCESDVNAILSREFVEIARTCDDAAADIATYSSCCSIIGRLARDKVFGGTSASDYLETELGGRVRPALRNCARELDTALARFDRSLAESTITLASELAEYRDTTAGSSLTTTVDVRYSDDLDAALRNLGFNASAIAASLSLDIWALLNSRMMRGLLTKATGMAATIFARPAAAAAAEVTIAAADGPLPIGDAIALAGGVWTAYDIYASRAAFERELKATLADALPDMKRSVHDQLMTRIRGTLDAHTRAQNSIRTASTDTITR